MKLVMWDMMKADELYMRILGKDSTARFRKENIRLYEEVLLLHKTTKGQFDSSYKYYEAHPIEFKLLIDSLEAFSVREKNQVREARS
jgi:parvulin-like peptidyl-prolyl isomerase